MSSERHKFFILLVLILMNFDLFECARRGGSRRPSSSRVTTQRPQRRATTYRSAQAATTPRYNIQTQQSHPSYNQPGYNNQPHYNQPGYNNQPHYNQPGYNNQPHYNQPGYNNQPHYSQPGYNNQPHYNQPGYNQPHYNQPYNPSFPNNNYQTSGIWQQKKDHSVRNSVLAGLGGSALGVYLGYKLGGLTNSYGNNNNNPNYIGGPNGYPQYSVVHHYHHGDNPIPKDGKVEADVIKQCENVTFCTPNTTPLCMTNGTVYCIAVLDSTIICSENSTEMRCVNSTITLPCDNSTSCNGTSLNTTSISIPCVTNINVFGDFGTNKLTVHKLSKRSPQVEASATTEGNNSTSDVTTTPSSVANASSTSTEPALQSTSHNPSSALTSQGISNKYCVTVIAEPIKEPQELLHLTNEEFAKLTASNQDVNREVNEKWSQVSNSILNNLFF